MVGKMKGKSAAAKMVNNTIDMVNEWGIMCDTYEPGCACCEAWRLFNPASSAIPTSEAVRLACASAVGNQKERSKA